MFRIGQSDNPMVFPLSANYTENLLYKDPASGDTYISPRAAGADKFRYSTNWGSTYSKWFDYTGANTTVETQAWSGTEAQKWSGKHVILMYWSDMTGSSDHVQHTDLDRGGLPSRRWPHVFVQGPFNQYGYDGGLPNNMALDADGLWKFDLIAEWPTDLLINVWGMNPDGYPDKSAAYGDVDGDNVLDWVPPDSLARNIINVSSKPSMPHLGYKIVVNDGNYHYYLIPVGSAWTQLILSIILGLIPIISAAFGFWAFKRSFYQVKHNEIGVSEKRGLFDFARGSKRTTFATLRNVATGMFIHPQVSSQAPGALADALHVDAGAPDRRTVLIATMEYNIEDWNIGVKIGGLGVMASLMGKNLGHQDLIWVVPCVGDIDYPRDQPGEPMDVVILGNTYEIEVQYHILRNITFILLDAPIFRKQTKTEPYPPRMDDLDSAIYYSAWNQCIAFALERFPVDIYHINDYHGTVAPLHLLPRTIPVCLSLHNAEFQGLWSLRKPEDKAEISKVYNLPEGIVEKYVQFGEVFNLLHAGASYLRIHQKGFGAVGVSKKYGKRSW
jgi:alpha-1,3-glucan synthase